MVVIWTLIYGMVSMEVVCIISGTEGKEMRGVVLCFDAVAT
jgi:hypothetical protein